MCQGEVINSLGWTVNRAVSPEAVLRGVSLLIDVDLVPLVFKRQLFLHKVNK